VRVGVEKRWVSLFFHPRIFEIACTWWKCG
jgi:hypothetical protein